MRIIISGLAGTGKSSVAKHLARVFKLRHISAGDLMRDLAVKHGFNNSGEGFTKFIKQVSKEIDDELNKLVLKELRKNNCVIDSRLMAYLFKGKAIRILLKSSFNTRAKRIAERDKISLTIAKRIINERDNNDVKRFNEYGININDLSIYDLTLNTELVNKNSMNKIIEYFIKQTIKKE